MAFVLDASAALPWCFQDETSSASSVLEIRASSRERIFVPSHWPTEMLNGLTRAARRGRIDDPKVDQFLYALGAYFIVVDRQPFADQWNDTISLIRKHRLSAYDAAYLALAIRLNVELATFDDQLRQAAQAEGIALAV